MWDWIALLLQYVINPARRLTTYIRRYGRTSGQPVIAATAFQIWSICAAGKEVAGCAGPAVVWCIRRRGFWRCDAVPGEARPARPGMWGGSLAMCRCAGT